MRKISIVLQCAALAAIASLAAVPAGANAPAKPAPAHAVRTVAAATPKPVPTPNPNPTCGPPVDSTNAIDPMRMFARMNPFVQHCPV